MKRVLMTPSLTVDDQAQEISISINLDAVPIWRWCLELCLLRDNLAEALTISSKSAGVQVTVSTGLEAFARGRALVTWQEDEAFIQITDTELEYWLAWSLKYYRDGIANVNHIDVEIASRDSKKGITLTLRVDNAQPSVSAEEARRRLNI